MTVYALVVILTLNGHINAMARIVAGGLAPCEAARTIYLAKVQPVDGLTITAVCAPTNLEQSTGNDPGA